MAQVRISNETIVQAMQSQKVRDALSARRNVARRKAEQIMDSEQVDGTLTVEDGTRPRGRPYARLLLDNSDQEWGTGNAERRRVLGRAAE